MNVKEDSELLELPKISAKLAQYATLKEAKERAAALSPARDITDAEQRLERTERAAEIIGAAGAPKFAASCDITPLVKRAKLRGVLNPKELLDIAKTLRTVREIKRFSENAAADPGVLSPFFDRLTPDIHLEERLYTSIKNENELNDEASPELYGLRRKITTVSEKMKDCLQAVIKNANTAKYLREAVITQRGGRYVVPVKTEYRGKIRGFIHDASASGSTLFVEPAEAAEMNDEIAILRAGEQREIEKILRDLSECVADRSDTLLSSYRALVELNLIFAEAEMGLDMNGVKPALNRNGIIKLHAARHPLLDPAKAVPIDISLGESYSALIITGSNTGGKTVAVKTAGLLTLMAKCGLLIPAAEGSRICAFDNVLCDIGDEQSLENQVSTFSSHMKRVISIIERSNGNSLVLLDEIGSGTDPDEGAALAEAILNALMSKHAKIIATTHYSELKSYAMTKPGAMNACVEFDEATLKPTYRLLTGVPGSSNAFEISRKLGLNEEIVTEAESLSRRRDNRLEEAVKKLHELNTRMRNDADEYAKLKAEMHRRLASEEQRREEYEKHRKEIIDRTEAKSLQIIDNLRTAANETINSLEKAKKDESKSAADKFREAKASLDDALRDMNRQTATFERYEKPDAAPFLPGDTVEIIGTSRTGTVIASAKRGDRVTVETGNVQVTLSERELRHAGKPESSLLTRQTVTRAEHPKAERSSISEIDLRGLDSVEAIMELDRFIDGAVLNGLGTVWIIHGKGTGTLRKAVQSHLRNHPSVKSYRPGTYGEGENGVTVAELK